MFLSFKPISISSSARRRESSAVCRVRALALFRQAPRAPAPLFRAPRLKHPPDKQPRPEPAPFPHEREDLWEVHL